MEDRMRQAVTQITGDMSLTDEMDDQEAAVLLEWGSGMAKALVAASADQSPEQVAQYMDEQIPNLRRVIRRINQTIGGLGYEEPEEVAGRLSRVFEATQQSSLLMGCPVPEDMPQFAASLKRREKLDALNSILRLLTPDTLTRDE